MILAHLKQSDLIQATHTYQESVFIVLMTMFYNFAIFFNIVSVHTLRNPICATEVTDPKMSQMKK